MVARNYLLAMIALLLIGLAVGYAISQLSAPKSGALPAKTVDIATTVIPDVKLGADGATHDAFNPTNFTVYVGQTVNLTIINYDDMPHTFSSTALGVSFNVPGSTQAGVPSVVHYQFTVDKAGVYRWWCATPCDSWAMSSGFDGQLGQIGYMGGFVSVLQV